MRYAADLRFLIDRFSFMSTKNARSLIFSDTLLSASTSTSTPTPASTSSSFFSLESRTKRTRTVANATINPESLPLPDLEAYLATLAAELDIAARDTGGNGKHGPLERRQKYRRIDTQLRHARRVWLDVQEDETDGNDGQDAHDARTTSVEQLFDIFGEALFPYTHVLATADAASPLTSLPLLPLPLLQVAPIIVPKTGIYHLQSLFI